MENKRTQQQHLLGNGDHGRPSSSSQTTMDMKSSVLYGSQEDIHGKNFRGRGRGEDRAVTSANKRSPTTRTVPWLTTTSLPSSSRPPLQLGSDPTENGSLYKYIEEEKQGMILRKAVRIFLYGALKKSSGRLVQYEAQLEKKSVECAARLILHNLLLNSWRKDRIQLAKIVHDNALLSISVENLGLQLRVLRHLQNQEKDRANEKVGEIRTLKSQVNSTQKSLKNVESDLASVQEELRYMREDNEKLAEQKSFTEKELNELVEQQNAIMAAVDLERKRATRAEEECRATKSEYAELRKQVKDLSNQSFQWKERARNLESKEIQIGDDLELRETSLRVLQSNFKVILADVEHFKMKKAELQEAYEEAHRMLNAEAEKSRALKLQFETTSSTVTSQLQKLVTLEESIVKLRAENQKTEKEFYWHKLKNVRNRRAWVNAVSIISSPTKLIQYLVFGRK